MARFETYRPLDRIPAVVGDSGFIGVNMRLDPAQLPPGYVSEAINCRFNRGIVESRKGIFFPVWANKALGFTGTVTRSSTTATFTTTGAVAHGFYAGQRVSVNGFNASAYNGAFTIIATPSSSTFTYTVSGSPTTPDPNTGLTVAQGTVPWGTIYGVGVFADPVTAKTYLIVATAGGVYYTSPNNVPYQISLPSGVTLTGPVNFTQAFDRLIMHRGETLSTLELHSIGGSWQEVATSFDGTGTETIPNADRSLYFQNRLFIPFGNDTVAVSDFNDYTRYVPILQEFRVNQGSADHLVTIEKFNDTTIVAFKDRSIYAINNVYGDLSSAQLDELTNRFGCVAPRSVVHVGNDLWFLSQLGIMSIRQTEQNKLQGVALPVSEPIQPLIDRINWRVAHLAWASYWDNKYYLAVPLDSSEQFGEEMWPSLLYPATMTSYVMGVESGKRYRWVEGSHETSLTNGTETLSSSGDFTAQGSTVTVAVTGDTESTGSLRQIITNSGNTAILVYDLLNQAWSGYDQSNACAPVSLFTFPVNGRDRLFMQTSDGFVVMYEETFEDQLTRPYSDFEVVSDADSSPTFQINGGTIFSNDTGGLVNNTVNGWGTDSVSLAKANLFIDANGLGGFSTAGTGGPPNFWTAPNTIPTKIATGVRFYATNGIVPDLSHAPSDNWYTFTKSGVTTPVVSSVTTREYVSPTNDDLGFSWLIMDIETWSPSYSVTAITTGDNEEFTLVSSRTKDRTAWYKPFDKAVYTLDNTNGDFMDKYREDYSILMGSGSATGETDEIALYTVADGIRTDIHQQTREAFHLVNKDRGLRTKVENNNGRFRLNSIALEASKEPTTGLTLA